MNLIERLHALDADELSDSADLGVLEVWVFPRFRSGVVVAAEQNSPADDDGPLAAR